MYSQPNRIDMSVIQALKDKGYLVSYKRGKLTVSWTDKKLVQHSIDFLNHGYFNSWAKKKVR